MNYSEWKENFQRKFEDMGAWVDDFAQLPALHRIASTCYRCDCACPDERVKLDARAGGPSEFAVKLAAEKGIPPDDFRAAYANANELVKAQFGQA